MTKINYLGKRRLYKLLQAGLEDACLLSCPYPCKDFSYDVFHESGVETLHLDGYPYSINVHGSNFALVWDDLNLTVVATFMRGCSAYWLERDYLEMGEYIDFPDQIPPEGERVSERNYSEYSLRKQEETITAKAAETGAADIDEREVIV
jgi:hypothetical protein